MTIYNRVEIDGTEQEDIKNILVDKATAEYNTNSSFKIDYDSPYGRHATDFTIGDEVKIYADTNEILSNGSPSAQFTFNTSGTTLSDSYNISTGSISNEAWGIITSNNTENFIYIYDGISSTVTGSFAGPGTNTRGLTFDTVRNLISSDSDTDHIYLHSGVSSTLTGSFYVTGTSPITPGTLNDITVYNGNLITTDSQNRHIRFHSGISSIVTGSFSTAADLGLQSPGGIAVDTQGDLWVTNTIGNNFFRYSGLSSTLIGSVPAPDILSRCIGMDFNVDNLLFVNQQSGLIFYVSGVSDTVIGSFTTPFGSGAAGLVFDIPARIGSGKIGSSLEFPQRPFDNAFNFRIITGSPNAWTVGSGDSFGHAMWLYPTGSQGGNFSRIVEAGYSGWYPGHVRMAGANGSMFRVTFSRFDGTNNPAVNSDFTLPLNTWSHIVASYNVGSDYLYMYYNGNLVGSTLDNTDKASQVGAQSSTIFGDTGNGDRGYSGRIDDYRVFKSHITDGEVKALYNNGSGIETVYAGSQLLLNGIIEDVKFTGKGTRQRVSVEGSDYSAILQDIICASRIFKNEEVSDIVNAIMTQNVGTKITTNNVNTTTTTIDKLTLVNISVFDALKKLADLSGYFFYVDIDKDLHFEKRDTTSEGLTFDNTNIQSARFTTSDTDLYNRVTVYGDRYLTGVNEVFTVGTDNTGSVFILDNKPFNTIVQVSGTTNTFIQPGGILNIDDPAVDNVKYLVDFQGRNIILTSGTTAGDNTYPNGSVIIIDYQRLSPVIGFQQDNESIIAYGRKDKTIIDRNIKDPLEANLVANDFVNQHKNIRIQGDVKLKGVLNVTPGKTVNVNLDDFNQSGLTYSILNARYDFNTINNLNESALSLQLNKKISDFTDTFKEEMLRLRALEAAELDSNITDLRVSTGSIGVSGTPIAIQRSIGSAFYFHVTNHNVLNSPSSLLGDMRTGSTVLTLS